MLLSSVVTVRDASSSWGSLAAHNTAYQIGLCSRRSGLLLSTPCGLRVHLQLFCPFCFQTISVTVDYRPGPRNTKNARSPNFRENEKSRNFLKSPRFPEKHKFLRILALERLISPPVNIWPQNPSSRPLNLRHPPPLGIVHPGSFSTLARKGQISPRQKGVRKEVLGIGTTTP